jgi:hypothetical protein
MDINEHNEKESEAPELDELDVEQFTKQHPPDCRKPKARHYVIRIDRQRKRVCESELTGRQILGLVDKTPECHLLYQKLRGGEVKTVEPCDVVSFVAPGVERFQTNPKDTCEGAV